ncbi:MAG: two-component regulator propeller domain-containing protein [Candidatus Aminicenantaceae bacterium]
MSILRRHWLIWIGFLVIFSSFMNLEAQQDSIEFERISQEEGLSQGSVFCILQDKRGYIWIGTEAGLNRYDGYNIKVYTPEAENPNSLSNNYIYTLYEEHQGNLWIGTDSGLNKYVREKDQFIRFQEDPNNPNSIKSDKVYAIEEDNNGILWIGTSEGLNKYDRKKGQFIHYQNDPGDKKSLNNNDVRALCKDSSGTIWIGTYGGGLNQLIPVDNKENSPSFNHYQYDPNNPHSLSDNKVLCVFEDKSGILWIGTENEGLNRFNRKKKQFTHYQYDPNNPHSLSDSRVNAIFEDRLGTLWVGTHDGGLNKYRREKDDFIIYKNDPIDPTSLCGNRIFSIYEDFSGVLWIGAYATGISKFYRGAEQFKHFRSNLKDPHSLSYNHVRSFHEDSEGILWVGTDGGGLNRFDKDEGWFIHYKHNPEDPNTISNNKVFSICEDSYHYILWIGTYGGGLNRLIPNDKKRASPKFTSYKHNSEDIRSLSDNRIRVVYIGNSGELWIGTDGGGLNRFDRESKNFVRYMHDPEDPQSLSNNRIFSLLEDSSGNLWVGTFGSGLDRFDRNKEQFVHHHHDPGNPHSISNDYLLCIHEDPAGILWIGSNGGGLTRFNPTKKVFKNYGLKDGLPDSVVYGILEDDSGNLWMSSNKGIAKFNKNTETIKSYDIADGLQGNEFNGGAYYESPQGEMFFGGTNGYNSFFPQNIKDNPQIPLIEITDFKLFDKSVRIGEEINGRKILEKSVSETTEIILSYKENVFSFDFAALHYVNPDKNMYKYKMEGFDKEWHFSDSKKRFASYMNLKPEEYVFKVKASNSDGLWNEEGKSLDIIITPPFWQTWWFRSFVVVSVLLLVFLIYRMRTHSIRQRSKELEEKVNERTDELQRANKELQKEINTRKKLENRAKRRAIQSALIYKVGQRMSSELEWKALLSEIVASIQESFNYYGVMLLLVEEETKLLNLQSIAGGYSNVFPKDLSYSIGEGMTGNAALTGETQVSGDVSKNPHYVREAEKTQSEMSVPIKRGKKVIGVLDIQSGELNAFDETDVSAMETLSTQISSAIENAQLYEQAQDEIKERIKIEEQLKDFAYIVSHDLKAPLRAISQLALWISEDYKDLFDSEGKEKIDLLTGRVNRMSDLIDGVLAYSRAGREKGKIEEVDLNDLMSEIIDNLAPPEHIKTIIEKPLPTIQANKTQVQQIFQNLISNAIKYMDKPKGEVTVGCVEKENYWRFSIKDNGPGIDKKNFKKIFKMFQTLESRDVRESTGVGSDSATQIFFL